MSIVSDEFGRRVDQLSSCIAYMEGGMKSLKQTPYHRVLGKNFLKQTDDFAAWLIEFHRMAATYELKLNAAYVEMNGFTINTDQWHCDAFGYKKAGPEYELEWLSNWDTESTAPFVLRGMEPVQKAFKKLQRDKKQPLGVRMAEELAEHLVTARFMELVEAAHKIAKRSNPSMKRLPILATAHDWDTVHKTI